MHQQLSQIRACLKRINERKAKNAGDFTQMERNLQ